MAAKNIQPLDRPPQAVVRVPGSKSYTNRALLTAALAEGVTVLRSPLFGDDTERMIDSLRRIGLAIEAHPGASIEVTGCGGVIPSDAASLFVGNAGTAARFLPPALALGRGIYEIDGTPRMRERPMAPLFDALGALGARIECLLEAGRLPARVHGSGRLRGGTVRLPGHLTSQVVSGLLLSGPYMQNGLRVQVEGMLVSRPYVQMTITLMAAFGVDAEEKAHNEYFVAPGQKYRGTEYAVEPDASAATYFFAVAAITGGRVRVEGLGTDSLQSDLQFVRILEQMGCTVAQTKEWTEVQGPVDGTLKGVDVDMSQLSDAAQTLAVVAPFAGSPTRITGIGFIRRKETDRVAAVVRELQRLGIHAVEEPDGYVVYPGTPRAGDVETYDDHRMAMSFALLGLRRPGINILNPECTSKTFPDFWKVLDTLHL
jgi:3-phosphoshikimate 1-carboxyvinyltransferase